jgi:hypothetical protein
MPRGESTSSGKNKLGLTLPEVPKETSEQNHSENRYKKKQKSIKINLFILNLVSQMSVSNVYKKNLNNLIVRINKKIVWKNFLIQNVLSEN